MTSADVFWVGLGVGLVLGSSGAILVLSMCLTMRRAARPRWRQRGQ